MSIVKYGEWEIDVDIEKTKQFYKTLKFDNKSQAYRNFSKYCDNLTDEEKEFFNNFAIDPLKCNVEEVGMSKKHMPCGGHYYVFGKYISSPKEILLTVEELVENDFVDDRPDTSINAGIFEFDFQNPENEFSDIPDDIPDGCICINFWCEEMPWLLDEKCELESIYPPKIWEIRRIFKSWKENRQLHREYMNNLKHDIVCSFKNSDICFEEMSKKEVREYKKQWLSVYAPKDANMRKLNNLCVNSLHKYKSFLWHLLSFEFVKAFTEKQAQILFDKKFKDNAVIIFNADDLGYRIHNLSNLNSDFLNGWCDVTVTAYDFSWTYSKTHEEYIGPYYYERF